VNPPSGRAAQALYAQVVAKVIPVSSTRAAEMTKLLENIFRCVNIALVNELKMLCLRMGVDVWEVIEAASSKPFGFMPFYPGPAWAATAFRWTPSISHGKPANTISPRASSNWPAKSTPPCPTTSWIPLPRP